MTATTSDPVAQRVADAKKVGAVDPRGAQDAVWAWLEDLGSRLPDHAAQTTLAEIFCTGTAGTSVDGQTEGLLVGFTRADPGLDRLGRAVRALAEQFAARTHPWLGKRFVRAEQRGTNSVTRAGFAVKLIAPTYRLRRTGDHFEGFEMRNWVEAGSLDPDTDVLVIDYQENNPWPMNRIRDELVEIVPNTYLGKMIWRQDDGNRLLAYFALKTPTST